MMKMNSKHTKTNVSIGIFAHNEEVSIAASLKQLQQQSLFSQPLAPEVLVLENGSTDATAIRARETLATTFKNSPWRVIELERGDKADTWNAFVHRESNDEAHYLIFMDSDIEFGEHETLERLITALKQDPRAHISAGRIQKDIVRVEQKNVLEKMSVQSSELGQSGPPRLAGSLYAASAEAMRAIYLPIGLLVEDGFLRAMVLTHGFSEPENVDRLLMVSNASHYFEAVTNPLTLFRHERRLAIGTELNIMLFDLLQNHVAQGGDANDYIVTQNQANSQWVAERAREQMASNTFAFHLKAYAFKPLQQWWHLPPPRRWRQCPHAIFRFLFNAAASWSARRALKAGRWSW